MRKHLLALLVTHLGLAGAALAAGIEFERFDVDEVGTTGARLSWRLNLPADCILYHGRAEATSSTAARSRDSGRDHAVVLDALESRQIYRAFILAVSTDRGTVGLSKEVTFTTRAIPIFRSGTRGRNAIGAALRGGRGGSGAAWGDFDSDGDADLFVASEDNRGRLFRNDGDRFTDVSEDSGPFHSSRTVTWGDYSGDGHLDILLSTGNDIVLYANGGPPDFAFKDRSQLLPGRAEHNTEGAGFIDYDGDGALDVLVSNGEHGILLFRNEGEAGPLRDVSAAAGLGREGPGAENGDFLSIADCNGDGFTDFLYNLGSGLLFRNNGDGTFAHDRASGVRYAATGGERGDAVKMGTAFGDCDNDGDLDLFVPQRGPSRLFRNNGDGTFSEVTRESGDVAKDRAKSISAAWADFNLDGLLDLFVANEGAPHNLYVNNGDGTFSDRAAAYRVVGVRGRPRGVALADFDNDGDVDMFVNAEDGCELFVNDVVGDDASSLKVLPRGREGAIGATVRLYDAKRKLVGLREISGGENWGSQHDQAALFGVPPGDYVVRVAFTDGTAREVKVRVKTAQKATVTVDEKSPRVEGAERKRKGRTPDAGGGEEVF